MPYQTICQGFMVLGLILTGLAGYGSYHFGNIEQSVRDKKADELKNEISSLKAMTAKISEQFSLIYQSKVGDDVDWKELEMKHVPPGVTDYLLLLFTSDKGRISGKVRIKGSVEETSFSTTANNEIPVALRNLWVPEENQYRVPTVMQFMITEKTDPNSSLSILTRGYIDTRGNEPH
jgi:hypothetical protein